MARLFNKSNQTIPTPEVKPSVSISSPATIVPNCPLCLQRFNKENSMIESQWCGYDIWKCETCDSMMLRNKLEKNVFWHKCLEPMCKTNNLIDIDTAEGRKEFRCCRCGIEYVKDV